MSTTQPFAIVIGGGFYGCCLSLHLRAQGIRVLLLDQGDRLLGRASLVNQARVHYGYHYPRSYVTAVRSAVNFPRFVSDFGESVVDDFHKLYAIARYNSKVGATQFHAFCRKVGAPIEEALKKHSALFDRDHVEACFTVREHAFNAVKLAEMMSARLAAQGVEIRLNTPVDRVTREGDGITVKLSDGSAIRADRVIVAAYSGINTLLRNSDLPQLPMKHELTEIALVRHTAPLDGLGVTVMDGPFFSTMPFPSENAHSFTHVRYTPRGSWNDLEAPADPYAALRAGNFESAFPLMVKDASRFMPGLRATTHVKSLYEVKTVLLQNEGNDGRPILFRRDYADTPGLSVVMGGKIDNIYDIISALEGAETDDDRTSAILKGKF